MNGDKFTVARSPCMRLCGHGPSVRLHVTLDLDDDDDNDDDNKAKGAAAAGAGAGGGGGGGSLGVSRNGCGRAAH